MDKTFIDWATTLGKPIAIHNKAGFGMGAAALLDHLVLVGTGAVGAIVAVAHTGADGERAPLLVLAGIGKTCRWGWRWLTSQRENTLFHVAGLSLLRPGRPASNRLST